MPLAAERWGGGITINDNAVFKERAMRIAVEYGVKIHNPELEIWQSDLRTGPRISKTR